MTEQIRRFQPDDFEQIHRLNALEGWQDLLATRQSASFYEQQGFRAFHGFRKSR
ncbi:MULTISPECIES: hypothetical protein [unclassified Exiguobacterium]|uniref:hypothetical protein n=1 Tax=unclassified Exiguobacterium TaxID=2644629 RepID=UPI0028A6E388|nr:hypothetical protein [Exiguobacterium sp.]